MHQNTPARRGMHPGRTGGPGAGYHRSRPDLPILATLSRLGVLRLGHQFVGDEGLTFLDDYHPSTRSDCVATGFLNSQFYKATLDEQVALEQSNAQLCASDPLPNVPYIVLARGLGDSSLSSPGAEERAEQVWRQLQTDLAGRIPGGVLIVAEQSNHLILMRQPELVVDAIRQVVEMQDE